MKKFYFLIFLIIISNNISLFIYGIFQNYKVNKYIEKTQIKLIEHSALVIASHTLDDVSFDDTVTHETTYKGYKIILILKKLKKDLTTVDISIINKNKNYYSSYLKKY